MALSMDEQRMLAEIERRLVAEDPGLASCLTTFRRPGRARVLRSPRARIVGSLFTVLLVAMVSLMVYAMIPFRAHMARHSQTPYGPGNVGISATGNQNPGTREASASASATVTSSAKTAKASAPKSPAVRSPGLAAGVTQEPRTSNTDAGAPSAKP